MASETVSRYEVIEHDLAQHIASDNERFGSLSGHLERIDGKLDRLMLTMIGSAITIVVLLAGVLLGGGLR